MIRVGLVEAKVDQVNQRVHVNRSKCTKFDQSQWEELRVSHVSSGYSFVDLALCSDSECVRRTSTAK